MKSHQIVIVVILLLFVCVTLGVLAYVPEYQIRQSFHTILITFELAAIAVLALIGVGLGLAVIGSLVWLASIAYASAVVWFSMARSSRAKAMKQERKASLVITVAPPGSQVYASEIKGQLKLTHKPLYLSPGSVTDEANEPSFEEIRRWSFFQLVKKNGGQAESTLAELPQLQPPLPEHVDLADYVTEHTSLRHIFLGIGRLPSGLVQPISAPLSRLVHIAIAGSTGFGKSTCMQALGYQVLNARERPTTVMLDSQGVTFTPFEGDSRLLFPLASEPGEVKAILDELVAEMDRRKTLFAHWRGIDSLEKYNSVVDEAERLPIIPIFFDEFGLLSDDKDIASHAKKLAQAGRKFGMYLIAGSQTWYSNEIASSLKANLSTSIQFYAKSKSQSRVLLEDSAAFEITRPGQAFCRLPGQPGLIELQAPDIQSVLKIIPTLMNTSSPPNPTMPSPKPTDQDQLILDLFDEQAKRGEFNKAEIAIAVFGNKGGNQYKKIDEVLGKFGRV